MALSRLVHDISEFTTAWENEPLLSRNLGSFDDVLSPELLQETVVRRGLRKPFFRMIQEGAAISEGCYVRTIGEGPSALGSLVDPLGVQTSLLRGATLVVQGLRLYLPTVTKFCDELSDELGHPIHANAYLTPAGSRGAGAHYDFHSVFIRQVWGTKFWRVQSPLQRLPEEACPDSQEFATPVVLEARLGPGDCLYLPRGYIHDGWTDNEPSLHVTCSMIDPHTWASVLAEQLCEQALGASEELRSILPMRFAESTAALTQVTARRIEDLRRSLDRLDPGEVAAALITKYGPDSWDFRNPPEFQGLLDSLSGDPVGMIPAG